MSTKDKEETWKVNNKKPIENIVKVKIMVGDVSYSAETVTFSSDILSDEERGYILSNMINTLGIPNVKVNFIKNESSY